MLKRLLATPHKPAPIIKQRSIAFADIPPTQVTEAASFLSHVEHLNITPDFARRVITVSYDLHEHSLQELEETLADKGFHLETALLQKMMRALIYYVEETQIHNFGAPERLLKKSQNEAYTHAWEKHLHGDHDDTPEELRHDS